MVQQHLLELLPALKKENMYHFNIASHIEKTIAMYY